MVVMVWGYALMIPGSVSKLHATTTWLNLLCPAPRIWVEGRPTFYASTPPGKTPPGMTGPLEVRFADSGKRVGAGGTVGGESRVVGNPVPQSAGGIHSPIP